MVVAVPIFRFLAFRWLFGWIVWIGVLFVVRGLDMRLVASHPDTRGEVAVRFLQTADDIHIDGDEDLLHRATLNLVLNAVQAPARSEVRVEVGYLPPDQVPASPAFEHGAA